MAEDRPDREAIEAAKDVCGGCGAPLAKTGPTAGTRRGFAEYECTRESCSYKEIRLFGANYYDYADE